MGKFDFLALAIILAVAAFAIFLRDCFLGIFSKAAEKHCPNECTAIREWV